MVSPYPPERCGIALYASNLASELAKHINVIVIANKDCLNGETVQDNLRIVRCWRRNRPIYFFHIMKGVLRGRPDIIHVQHEFLAYGVRKYAMLFPLLLLLLRSTRKPIIVTMHSVVPRKELVGHFFALHGVGYRFAFIKRALTVLVTKLMGRLSHAIIVHNNFMKAFLVSDYGFDDARVQVIPHGVYVPYHKIKEKEAKRTLGLINKRVMLFFGFIIPGKGLEYLIKVFPLILEKFPNVILVIAGGYHPRLSRENPKYLGTIERLIDKEELNKKIFFENKFIAGKKLCAYIAAADIIVFPYIDESVIGASGALAMCALFGKPVVATNITRFAYEIKNGKNGILIEPNNEEQLKNAIIMLMVDEKLRKKFGKNMYMSSLKRTWNEVALMTLRIYEKMTSF